MSNYPGDTLKTGAKDLLKTGLFSDFVIKCDGVEFKVHKAILYPQSKYFQKLLSGQFKEATEKEGVLQLPENSSIMKAVIHYLYHFTWCEETGDESNAAVFAVKVFQAADKYDVEPLRRLAANRFQKACDPKNNVEDFVQAIYTVDECTADRTLWDIVEPLIKANMAALLGSDSFRVLIKEMEDLNLRLLAQLNPYEQWTGTNNTEDKSEDEEMDEEDIPLARYAGVRGRRLGVGGPGCLPMYGTQLNR